MSNIDFRNTYRKLEDGTMELVSSVEIVNRIANNEIDPTEPTANASIQQRKSGGDYEGQSIEE